MIRSMLWTLGDKFTRSADPERGDVEIDITGVGLNIAEDANDPERVRVLGMVLDSSAMKAGIEQEDEIVAVNGEKVRGLSRFRKSLLIQETKGKESRAHNLARGGGRSEKRVAHSRRRLRVAEESGEHASRGRTRRVH